MTENKYIDLNAMQEKADKEFADKVREHNKKIDEQREKKAEKEHQEMSRLFNGLSKSIENDAKIDREKEMNKEKSRTIKKIEDKYDKQGLVKSDSEKEIDKAYSKLLGNEDKSSEPDLLSVDRETYNHSLGFDEVKKSNPDKVYSGLVKKLKSKDDDTSIL
ncbi:hypothetical protein [Companilactobacillus sp. HBUAS59699]|uniref:hypothetical protein n=1 Tax=Companilactobacillus sp. HBUAS59699 TaxID=3109358 RepID=UPI002FF260EC